ncbi:sugar phosphate isomerase/epimerase [Neolewinella xylanilytica]|uniref:Sugar phosphate isomerase/epimerase n=1 Tax=Neolewinella xylanilytica TaxID=1514080 RepID=A0A2S6I988_9BACT|nr:sugar phosphate isomerase/epimerase [Neolewinella xylanilytica]PPK88048.1 sugar phosphate isomerase/epimerase [Neolewinella xylanilytica]
MRPSYFSFLCIALLLTLSSCGTSSSPDNAEVAANTVSETATDQFGGIALYTLRDTMGKDPRAVLQAVADLGYEYIEAAGYSDGKYYGMEPAAFKAMLDEVGLKPMSSHQSSMTRENAKKEIADAKAAGFEYIVIPVPPEGLFKFDPATRKLGMSGTVADASDIINAIAAEASAQGMKALYHNHDFEFVENEEGIVPIDYFIENSDPEDLNFQMDLYWVTKAGADPVEYFERYPGRFKAWHVKDIDDQGRFAPVGTGSIDFARILAAKEQSGMEFYLVEQDATFNETPMEAIEISHRALGEIGFE